MHSLKTAHLFLYKLWSISNYQIFLWSLVLDMRRAVCLLSFLLLPSSETLKPGFSVGRISEGQFEYSELNGWMTPRRARSLCEENSQCGGFTYKVKQQNNNTFEGVKLDTNIMWHINWLIVTYLDLPFIIKILRRHQGSILLDREVDIYFFHVLINIETDIWSWKWVYYTASKKYIRWIY